MTEIRGFVLFGDVVRSRTDAPAATKFYSDLFGWTTEVMKMPGMDYTTFALDGRQVAGMMSITPEMGNFPSHWGTYFTVDDTDAAASKAE